MLWEVLSIQHGFKFLLTNRLNEDCIENLFSLMRAIGARKGNPDAGQFRAEFQQVMVDNVMAPSKSVNCEADVDSFICSLKHMKEAPSTSTEHELSSVMDQVALSWLFYLHVRPQIKNVPRICLTKKIICLCILQGT